MIANSPLTWELSDILPAQPKDTQMRHSADKASASESTRRVWGNQKAGIAGIVRTRRTFKKAIQQGRSERKPDVYFPKIEDWNGWAAEVAAGCSKRFSTRPQRAQRRRVLFQYVEPLSEARTKLETVFNTLPNRSRLRFLDE